MTNTQVVVAGAGPGGAVAAMFLAQQGVEVTLVDKANFPRDKICGDGLSGWPVNILNRLDTGIIKRLNARPEQLNSWGVRFVSPNHQYLDVPFAKQNTQELPPGFVIPRHNFDHFLIQEVKQYSNIRLLEGVKLVDAKISGTHIDLLSSEGVEVRAKLAIIADGAQSTLSRKLTGTSLDKKHHIAGIRAYYRGVSGIHADNFIELHFLKEFLPGYFWIFPLPNGMANVGLGIRSDRVSKEKINLSEKMLQAIREVPYLEERFRNAEQKDKIRGFGLPLGSKRRKISGDRFMLVGDAASLIDPFTGEGIGNAMASGMIAAEHAFTCLKKNSYSTATMAHYDREVYRRLGKELQLSTTMQKLLRFPRLFNFIVKKAEHNPYLKETIASMMDDINIREKLKQPSFYFKLLFN